MKIVLIGNLVGYAYSMTKFFRARGVDAHLLLSRHETGMEDPRWEDPELTELPEWIHCWDRQPLLEVIAPTDGVRTHGPHFLLTSALLLRQLRQYDLIFSFAMLSIYSSFAGTPYVACANGSDLRELARQSTPRGRLMRRAYRKADRVVLWNTDHIGVARELGLTQARFYPFAVDTERFSPLCTTNPAIDAIREKAGRRMLIFHPTHLDWTYREKDRWTKGNDRLLRAFARFVSEGHAAFLVLLDRGPDREPTRRLIAELGIQEHTQMLPEINRAELPLWFSAADLVVDQFVAGSFGTIAIEAMACGTPLVTYMDEEYARLGYGDTPPVLNSRVEEEIYQRLLDAEDTARRREMGERSRQWALQHHSWERVVDDLIEQFKEVVANRVRV